MSLNFPDETKDWFTIVNKGKYVELRYWIHRLNPTVIDIIQFYPFGIAHVEYADGILEKDVNEIEPMYLSEKDCFEYEEFHIFDNNVFGNFYLTSGRNTSYRKEICELLNNDNLRNEYKNEIVSQKSLAQDRKYEKSVFEARQERDSSKEKIMQKYDSEIKNIEKSYKEAMEEINF